MKVLDEYSYTSNKMPISIKVYRTEGEFVPLYEINISSISKTTEIVLEKIRQELVKKVDLGIVDITDVKKTGVVEEKFKQTIAILIDKFFPGISQENMDYLSAYLIQKSLGMGNIEILLDDNKLEEIAVNSADEPVWVYHKTHGWLKTNVRLENEEMIKHYATMIGRRVGRQINILTPLLDANLQSGNRVNATLMPISNHGNTITLRKFASKAWTITDLITGKTISPEAAAFLWLGVQYELSFLIAGGTAAGKTSMLNVVTNFFPPNQRIISIEDTREIMLPKFLHWVPMLTRQPNAEGKGEIAMLDLLVNSLRMRPDRIIVGEIRREKEAQVLFEAIHTGHSVYATVHANNAQEVITRLTSPPINVPLSMIPAISLMVVQNRNRRTGQRRTFQIAEILKNGQPNVLMQHNTGTDSLHDINRSVAVMDTLELYTGMKRTEIEKMLKDKVNVLNYLVSQKINEVDSVGRIMAEYYTNKENLMQFVEKNKPFTGAKEG